MDNSLWFKDDIFYELHVRAFQDGNQDGIGDFIGLTRKLDYLVDLGITAVWLLPFTRSPLKDDGYDIADYLSVHPNYGSLDDFKLFLEKAHAAGIRVITELVINHTSDQHPWFQRARHAAPGSAERNFYVWSDDSEKYSGVPLMFPDFENSNWTWDPVAKQYYWHRFYSHQPDLNFDNPAVRQAIMPIVDFWFEMGVDGMRLDAVPYLIEREGTTCEHLPETHGFLKELRAHIEARFPDRMILAEANAWPDDMVAYFGKGDECHMAFHFPLMPRLFMALHQEDRFPITDILAQTPAIPHDCQWCLFLRNHDELTLAMVTDEERDAMYDAYAHDHQARLFLGIRHRLGPLLRNDRRRIELMNAILFSLPGTPVIYYGDEIGMGDNIYLGDRNGVRTPMQWTADRNAGFSLANSQKLYLPVIVDSEYHYEAVNVETQQNNPSSLLWWMKRLIALRKRHPAFGRGELHLIEPDNSKVIAYVRETEFERVLVVANLSRFVQNVQLDLNAYAGLIPNELFGHSRFPAIQANQTYGLTLGPHNFYWFALSSQKELTATSLETPTIRAAGWNDLFRGPGWDSLSPVLAARHAPNLHSQLIGARVSSIENLKMGDLDIRILACRLEYANEAHETLFQPLILLPRERFEDQHDLPHAMIIGRMALGKHEVLCDPLGLPEFASELAAAFSIGRTLVLEGTKELAFRRTSVAPDAVPSPQDCRPATVQHYQQTLATISLDHRFVLRMLRRPDEGTNPDVEVGQLLHDKGFLAFAPLLGTMEYGDHNAPRMTVGTLHAYVNNQGTALQLMLDQASRFFEMIAAHPLEACLPEIPESERATADANSPTQGDILVSPFMRPVRTLADFTARLHRTVASDSAHPTLAPTPLNPRSYYQTLRNAAGRLQARLRETSGDWPVDVQKLASRVNQASSTILKCIEAALAPPVADSLRIRSHGDYRLGQFLVSGQDFILTNFEGKRDRPIANRRLKRVPFYDVAALLSSIDYAVSSVRLGLQHANATRPGTVREEDRERLEASARQWVSRMDQEFFDVYTAAMDDSRLLPTSSEGRRSLFELTRLGEALKNADYDLALRPDWAVVPLSSILHSLERLSDTDSGHDRAEPLEIS
ncbi:maltose alpha-D-glucosyltransferase [Schlesneria paludicola]|uniref:maltose alpha-D-glucosyltransferase n=1 Tax=Schlesneria paludicola TaxID=360056 RepID=UPI00029A8D53|nr:maltose alpha-D-glucosyltransferase [Schlesneria paludicola]